MATKFISYYEKYVEEVSFQTMVIGNLVLVLTNGNKTFIIECRIWIYVPGVGTGNLGYPTANWGHVQYNALYLQYFLQ